MQTHTQITLSPHKQEYIDKTGFILRNSTARGVFWNSVCFLLLITTNIAHVTGNSEVEADSFGICIVLSVYKVMQIILKDR